MANHDYKSQLLAQQRALLDVVESGDQAAETVTLDQSRVGRLSRMDALAQQELAKATALRRESELRQIAAALQRLEDDDFGLCVDCDEAIAAKRLQANPAVTRCIQCAELREA